MRSRSIPAQPCVEVVLTGDEANAVFSFIAIAGKLTSLKELSHWKTAHELSVELAARGAQYLNDEGP
jgi:hypothetical protein